jgi:hypothetical protein
LWLYIEAAPACVTRTVIELGTECKLVDRRRESGREILAARCTKDVVLSIGTAEY